MAILTSGYTPPRKRRVFFSFHYADIMRVNNVRDSGEFATSALDTRRHIEGFYDFSLWEKRKLEGEDSLRRLIREGTQNTSAICVLIGTNTWRRPWVLYEIARSVVDGRGLLAVHINSINDHQPPYRPDALGFNPCNMIGIALRSDNNNYYLCEQKYVETTWAWKWYDKHVQAVEVPKYMRPPRLHDEPVSLAAVTRVYDWANNGAKNIGGWVDQAARDVGR
jgi:hypothetical protein